jgi:outer membrane receptor protein involved in Fe transport
MRVLLIARVLVMLLVSGFVVQASHAQSTDAAVGGQITDEQGRVVPGAAVVLTNLNTAVVYEAKTNGDGIYNAPALPPGIYRANVTKDGFKSIVKGGIELHVQDIASINFQLQVGSVAETVTVEAGGLIIDMQDATVSTTIDRNFAENLPLNGRSLQTLILLSPGTVLTPSNVGTGNAGSFSVNGQRSNANSFTVDGVSANVATYSEGNVGAQLNGSNASFTVFGGTQSLVSIDALQEFKIDTSTYAPEFGRQPGGQVSLLTRSGTNDFHGTAFDYVRNDIFDANNWFNGYTNNPPIPKGKERQNDFGGTLGGPIFKDKTFFFFSYEGLRLLQPVTFVDTVPSVMLRQGSTPAYQAILDSWPIPDGPEFIAPDPVTGLPAPAGGAPYTFSQSQPTNADSYSIRIDHSFAKRTHVFARYASSSSDAGDFLDSQNFYDAKLKQRSLTIGTESGVGANLSNELRLNYTVNVLQGVQSLFEIGGGKAFDGSLLFPSPLQTGADDARFILNLPNESFLFSLGSTGKFSQRQIDIPDNVSLSTGPHLLKWGIDYRRLFPIFGPTPLQAVYEPSSNYPDNLGDLNSGTVSFVNMGASLVVHPIYTNFSVYAQDTWRVSNRLTLTFGLRWDLNPAPGERDGIQPFNVIGLNNPATATLAPLNSPMYKTTYNNFAPRVGLAYQLRQAPGHETVIRGGFGVFYDLNSETTATGYNNTPFQNFSSITNIPFPVPNNLLPSPPVPAPLTPPYYVNAIDPNLKLPYTLQWNFSIEQALGQNQSLTASYVASAGYRLLRSDELFDVNPDFTEVTVVRNASSSNYQSLQLQFNRRLSHGLQALVSYTYSHSIDNASSAEAALSTSVTGAFLNPNIDRGNSDFDLRHAFRGALTYNIPSWNENFLSKAVLGGWSLDIIGVAQTGLPVDLVGSSLFIDGVVVRLRPNVVAGQPFYLYGQQCAAANGGTLCPGGMGFNAAAFSKVPLANGLPTQVQGTLGRNALRGFGAWQADFALHRQFNFTDKVNLQFRSEFFNIFNHPNFGPPNNRLGGGFGLATETLNTSYGAGLNYLYQIGGPRSIQLALKLVF